MTEYNQDVEMVAGDSKIIEVTCRDDAGVILVLTGFTVRWALADDTGTLLVEKDNIPAGEGGVTITNAVGGIFQVELETDDTEDLYGEYYHEAEIEDGDNNLLTVTKGEARRFPHPIPVAAPSYPPTAGCG